MALLIGVFLSVIEGISVILFRFPILCVFFPDLLSGSCYPNPPPADRFSCLYSLGNLECAVERDFSVYGIGSIAVSLMLVTQLMQSVLVGIAVILLLQICLNLYFFWRASVFPFKNSQRIGVRLNVRDDMGEFGLSLWNRAVNFTLFVVAIAMFIPIISKESQETPEPDIGQELIMYLVPLVLLVPVVGSFLIRATLHIRLKNNFHQLTRLERNSYISQEIWPFNRNIVSKILVSIIFVEYYYLWGVSGDIFGFAKAMFG